MASTPARRRATSTSNFGVGRRENHDASGFYERFTAPEISSDDSVAVAPETDEVWVHDAREMPELPDNSVALVVTSPPYFAGKAYEEELGQGHIPASYVEYLDGLTEVFAECVRVLEPGGRIAVNVANLGRKPYRSLSADVTHILQDRLGLLMRGEIVWQKARGAGGNCAWGSFRSAKNPVLRDLTERIVVASKGRFDRARTPVQRKAEELPVESTIGKDSFMDLTLDLWEFAPESATRVGHPAPFPVELPARLIQLYTFEGDLVLDPYMGSGTTGVAAVEAGRRFAGYDTDAGYAEAAIERIEAARSRLLPPADADQADAGRADPDEAAQVQAQAAIAPLFAGLTEDLQATGTELVAFQRQSTVDGSRAQELVAQLLAQCGFAGKVREKQKFPVGVEVNFLADDVDGGQWIFDVWGAFSSSRPGLKRTDTLWKALGKAAILATEFPDLAEPCRYVLLSTDLPPRASAGGKALIAAHQSGLVWDVLLVDEPATVAELLHLASGSRSDPELRHPVPTAYR
ncbi:MAG: site-specific DNA-methyltransferase [Aquihabitans sp.]